MLSTNNEEQKSPLKRFLLILGLLVIIAYSFLGAALLLSNQFLPAIGKPYRSVFGVFLIFYAIFRLARLIQSKKPY